MSRPISSAQALARAIENAAVLTRAPQSTDAVADALQLYQRNGIERTSRIVKGPDANRTLFHKRDQKKLRRAFAARDERSRSERLALLLQSTDREAHVIARPVSAGLTWFMSRKFALRRNRLLRGEIYTVAVMVRNENRSTAEYESDRCG
jgi:hypothetical protein